MDGCPVNQAEPADPDRREQAFRSRTPPAAAWKFPCGWTDGRMDVQPGTLSHRNVPLHLASVSRLLPTWKSRSAEPSRPHLPESRTAVADQPASPRGLAAGDPTPCGPRVAQRGPSRREWARRLRLHLRRSPWRGAVNSDLCVPAWTGPSSARKDSTIPVYTVVFYKIYFVFIFLL